MSSPEPGVDMRRREFLGAMGGATALWPFAARAQQASTMRRLGVLITGAESSSFSRAQVAAFRDGLEKLGWMDGKNIKVEYRLGASADQLRAHAAEFATMNMEVFFAGFASALTRLKEAIRNVPIVFA